jgi:hypothetical protein
MRRRVLAHVSSKTHMASGGDGANHSFNRLLRFITGGNVAKQTIAMGTPVYGYFDPPWSPSCLHWNEVRLRTEGGK